MKKFFRFVCAVFVFIFASSSAFCDSTTKYDDINFPQWSKDLRRTEIITFGSMPFVTLWTSLGYGLAVKGTFHNPLDKSSSGYTETDQKNIIMIAGCASLCLGLTDLAINLIQRKIKSNKESKVQKTIEVVPYSQSLKDLPPPQTEEEQLQYADQEQPEEYFVKGMENAIF